MIFLPQLPSVCSCLFSSTSMFHMHTIRHWLLRLP